MKTLFSLTYPVTPAEQADFAVTESEDGTLGVATNGMWIRIPFQAFQQLHDVLHLKQQEQGGADPCAANGAPLPLPANVRQLVIAAREVWEDADDNDKLFRLDKALEPFSEAVPYANQPERCAVSGKPICADDWHCGNRKLTAQFAIAAMIAGKACARDSEDLEYIAERSGPIFTSAAITRLMPGAIDEDQMPF